MTDIYSDYVKFVEDVMKKGTLTSFKNDNRYTYMLEHVTYEQGSEYLKNIISDFSVSIEYIRSFCILNDTIGNPNKFYYETLGIECSPTSLRYIYHALLAIQHIYKNIQNLNPLNIVEIGGGYGGLCLAIHFFISKFGIKINSYSIVDLTAIIGLQKRYLCDDVFKTILDTDNIHFYDANNFGNDIEKSKMFLISNYGYSELPHNLRIEYSNRLIIPKVKHGFMVWNREVYDFGIKIQRIEEERPLTFCNNTFVYI